MTETKYFTSKLLAWNTKINKRPMPWKGEKDPYKIWLSEIILQQTRVEQGWDYYKKFVSQFPDIKKLAMAPEQKIFKIWEGLGYYSRCKNLIATAKLIAKEFNGKFPDKYNDILKLKGIGPYTAAAIASFAFNQPYAVLDGNVFRVLARYFGNATPINSTEGKKLFSNLAQNLLDKKNPSIYNQALMDFGATVCKPKLPNCVSCPLKINCYAHQKNKVYSFPIKIKKAAPKNRWFYYFEFEYKNKILICKREAKDIWQNLFEFVLIEQQKNTPYGVLKQHPIYKNIIKNNTIKQTYFSKIYTQKLTHQTIRGQFFYIKLTNKPNVQGYQLVSKQKMLAVPFPKFITTYLKDKNVSLNLM